MKKNESSLTASGSATGNPRNKVSLGPGRSLIDWIKLGHSGVDLTGVGAQPQEVTKAELSKHCTPSDCWIALRGVVFNVTFYLPFHPGGEIELLSVAGTDATKAFNEAHAYVNYTSILQKCVVGRLVASSPSNSLRQLSLASCPPPGATAKPPIGSEDKTKPPIGPGEDAGPRATLDWSQTEHTLTLNADWSGPSWPITWICLEKKLVTLRLSGSPDPLSTDHSSVAPSAELRLTLEGDVKWPPDVEVEAAIVKVVFFKEETSSWTSCHREAVTSSPAPSRFSIVLTASRAITHDTRLLTFRVQSERSSASQSGESKELIWVPPGLHVIVHLDSITDGALSRPYTPVPSCISRFSCPGCPACPGPERLCLMVKRYPAGAVSPTLCSLAVGDRLAMTGPEGNFRLAVLDNVAKLTMLAAGTGLTPVVAALRHFLDNQGDEVRAHLVFFNRTKHDILWRKQLKDLAVKDTRFSVTFALSDPPAGWTGPAGRINQSLVAGLELQAEGGLVLICGPINFTRTAKEMLLAQGLPKSGVHCFLG